MLQQLFSFLQVGGLQKWLPKTVTKQHIKNETNKLEHGSLGGSMLEALGALFGIICACQFVAEKWDPPARPTTSVNRLTGGAQEGCLTKVK